MINNKDFELLNSLVNNNNNNNNEDKTEDNKKIFFKINIKNLYYSVSQLAITKNLNNYIVNYFKENYIGNLNDFSDFIDNKIREFNEIKSFRKSINVEFIVFLDKYKKELKCDKVIDEIIDECYMEDGDIYLVKNEERDYLSIYGEIENRKYKAISADYLLTYKAEKNAFIYKLDNGNFVDRKNKPTKKELKEEKVKFINYYYKKYNLKKGSLKI